jgi:hypothetical protein
MLFAFFDFSLGNLGLWALVGLVVWMVVGMLVDSQKVAKSTAVDGGMDHAYNAADAAKYLSAHGFTEAAEIVTDYVMGNTSAALLALVALLRKFSNPDYTRQVFRRVVLFNLRQWAGDATFVGEALRELNITLPDPAAPTPAKPATATVKSPVPSAS